MSNSTSNGYSYMSNVELYHTVVLFNTPEKSNDWNKKVKKLNGNLNIEDQNEGLSMY
jgi:hypothetical protein